MATRYDPPLPLAERQRRRARLEDALELARQDFDARSTLLRAITAMDGRAGRPGT